MFGLFTTNPAVALLKEDHDRVKALFDRFETAKSRPARVKVVREALSELKVHAAIEEELFYPAVRKPVGKEVMNEKVKVDFAALAESMRRRTERLQEAVEELFRAAEAAQPGGTILVNDGHYLLPATLVLAADDVTLRGRSGRRDRVILDGTRSRHGELVLIRGRGVTVADLTIENIKWNGFKIAAELGAQRATIHNCVIHNVWQRGVKASHVPPETPHLYPRDCRVRFCLFYNDRPKRLADDETDTPETYGGNYVGGIDAKNTLGWAISDNVFVGIQGRTREGRAAVYLSEEGRDCVVERNVIIDCDVGVALGNPSRVGDWMHCVGCLARNNFVTRCPEGGILACFTKDCRILHNTVHEPRGRRGRLIWVQEVNEGLVVANNLLSGAPVLVTGDGRPELRGNVVREDLGELFLDADAGNLRLAGTVRGIAGVAGRLPQVEHDIDGQARGERADVGADEWRPQEPAPPDGRVEPSAAPDRAEPPLTRRPAGHRPRR